MFSFSFSPLFLSCRWKIGVLESFVFNLFLHTNFDECSINRHNARWRCTKSKSNARPCPLDECGDGRAYDIKFASWSNSRHALHVEWRCWRKFLLREKWKSKWWILLENYTFKYCTIFWRCISAFDSSISFRNPSQHFYRLFVFFCAFHQPFCNAELSTDAQNRE